MALVFTYSITASSIYVHSSETQLSKHREKMRENHICSSQRMRLSLVKESCNPKTHPQKAAFHFQSSY